MNFAMNLEPHIAALLFLGSGALLVLLASQRSYCCSGEGNGCAIRCGRIAVLVFGYGVLLLAFLGLQPRAHSGPGQEKYFCELDCHIAYSVQNVQRMKSIGNATADGEFYVVTRSRSLR